MTETIIASVKKSFKAPVSMGHGNKEILRATAKAYQLGNNQHPHFSVTGEIGTLAQFGRGNASVCGCIHEEILRVWPAIKPIVDLHLSNADDGEPMHAAENGFYNLAGAVEGNFGERYHRGNTEMHLPKNPVVGIPARKPPETEYRKPSHAECLQMLAEHLRCPLDLAQTIKTACIEAYEKAADTVASSPVEELTDAAKIARGKAGAIAAKARFALFCDDMRPRWKAEAEAGVALIKEMHAKQQAAIAEREMMEGVA